MPYNWEDDIEVGNEELIGESDRGMQDRNYVGAATALARVRGALGQLAAGRGAAHMPVQKRLRSPFKDSTQIGITATSGVLTAGSFSGSSLPTMTGLTRVYKSFKPSKAVVVETVQCTFSASGETDKILYAAVSDSSDLLLTAAFSGADNCFPNAPSASNGINCATFAANALGVGISWPTINAGIDMTVTFAIRGSALARIATPDGFTLTSAIVTVDMSLLGPSLR